MKNTRTRLFLGVAIGILVAGLGTGLVAAYVGGFQGLAFGNGPDELAYVPADATMVAYADVRDIASSDLRQRLRALQPNTQPETFKEQTGIDVERDVDHVIAAAWNVADGPRNGRPLMLARGRFDDDNIETLIRQHGGDVITVDGTRVLVASKENLAVSFLEPGLVAVGNLESVRTAIRTKAGGKTIRDNAEVMSIIRDVDSGNAWAVARLDSMRFPVPQLPAQVAGQLPPINWFAFSGHISDGVSGTLHAQTRDDASAQDLREVIRGFMALARLQAGQKSEFADVVNSLELGGQGKDVTLSFDLPAKTVQTFAAMATQRRRDAGAPPSPGAPQQRLRRLPTPPSL